MDCVLFRGVKLVDIRTFVTKVVGNIVLMPSE